MGHLGASFMSHEKFEMAMVVTSYCCADAGGVLLELFIDFQNGGVIGFANYFSEFWDGKSLN